ncbi:hypothetical protein KMY60_27810, partial [Klebsiella pneumoniae]|uniref:hypothetical protein n=1 Tax=Klebsiella pneumoniae TaxID=573 RepID=UPI002005EF0E
SSTYGKAFEKFAQSWGGEVYVKPLFFTLGIDKHYDKSKKGLVYSDTVDLVPSVINLDNKIQFQKQEEEWLTFNAYTISSSDNYKIVNTTKDTAALMVTFERPFNAAVVHNLTFWANGKKIRNFEFEKPFTIDEDFLPEDSVEIKVTYT